MPFAPQIRKQVLQALEEHILPMLRDQVVTQVHIAPPFDLPAVEHWELDEEYLPDITPDRLRVTWGWKKQGMNASRFPYLILMYEGCADHRIGITETVAKQLKADTGKTVNGAILARLAAPGAAYFAPGVPGNSGADTSPIDYQSLCFSWMQEDVRFHLSALKSDEGQISHSLQIHDPLLIQMSHAYGEELMIPENHNAAQALLYAMMSRFHRSLQKHRFPLANSAFPKLNSSQPATADTKEWQLCQHTMDHIETRLSSPLNRTNIAKAMGVSSAHLGRIFHRLTGQTLMRYVTHRRLEAAKLVLAKGTENIAEIANLSGFTSAASFCAIFKRANGISPRAYRHKHRSFSAQKQSKES